MSIPQPKSTRPAVVIGIVLAVACSALVAVVSRGRAEQSKLRNELSAIQKRLDAATLKAPPPPTAEENPQRRPSQPTGSPPATDTAAPTATTATASDSKSESKRRLDADAMSSVMQSPMMQKIIASQTATMTQMTYNHLMDHLKLSPEERDHLQGLLVEKQTNLQNLGMQLMNPGMTPEAREAVTLQLTEAWLSGEEKIRGFLNDAADFEYYQAYSQQEPDRKEIGMFEASLPEGESLDSATSDALAKLQNEARKQFPFTVDFYDQRNFGNPSVLNAAAVQRFLGEQAQFHSQVAEKAAGLLTPERLALFKQNQSAARQMTTMQLNSIVQLAGGGR